MTLNNIIKSEISLPDFFNEQYDHAGVMSSHEI